MGEGGPLHLPHKVLFPVTIAVNVIGEPLCKLYFEFGVLLPLFFMGAHIVPKGQVPPDIVPIVCLKDVDLVGPLLSAFPKIAPARNSKLAEIFIAGLGKLLCNIIRLGKTANVPGLIENTGIVIDFDDSIIEDKQTERAEDRKDVSMGVMGLPEYRAKWYGETEEAAASKLPDQSAGVLM